MTEEQSETSQVISEPETWPEVSVQQLSTQEPESSTVDKPLGQYQGYGRNRRRIWHGSRRI